MPNGENERGIGNLPPVSGYRFCFFDLDGTLIRTDSYLPVLLAWLRKHPGRCFKVGLLPFTTLAWLAFRRRERQYIKEAYLTAFMGGARRAEIEPFVADFWSRRLPAYQNDAVVDRLLWHRGLGHRIYVATASFDFYTAYLTKVWPVDGVIATRSGWDGDVLTGKVAGRNCRGAEKVERIAQELGIDLTRTPYAAYSDSEADAPLLRGAAHAYLVRRGSILPWVG